jgi:ribosomal protein S3
VYGAIGVKVWICKGEVLDAQATTQTQTTRRD